MIRKISGKNKSPSYTYLNMVGTDSKATSKTDIADTIIIEQNTYSTEDHNPKWKLNIANWDLFYTLCTGKLIPENFILTYYFSKNLLIPYLTLLLLL